jgi:hypothetical protein
MNTARDFCNQLLAINDRIIVASSGRGTYFKIVKVIRFTEKYIVFEKTLSSGEVFYDYAKPDQVIKMTEELEKLNCFRILSR